uniref:Uncharacterized protein n=1 Tax=Roseihalotalea indica TaxID=2867963 RepID=A0AA49GUG2_9BACT|nr:hypothetical protein K4G66_07435 [Tunicatimonas sp. TK19036]
MDNIQSLEQLERPQLISETKDVVGFDLGHGDTSAARVSATGGRVQPLELVKGTKVIPTALGTRTDGSIVIGKDAFRQDVKDSVQQFKSAKVNDPQVSVALRTFVNEAVNRLRTNNSTIAFNPTTLMVFGCPSAWSDAQRLAYGSLLSGQVSNMQAMLVRESRAAFITMKEEKQLNSSEIRESVLIIDLGSSTTDFTFVWDLDPGELPVGNVYSLGASLIEHQLLKIALQASPERKAIEQWLQQHSGEYHRTVWKFREAKEDYFRDPSALQPGPPIEINMTYWSNPDQPLKLEAKLTADDFEKALDTPQEALGASPISWRARFRADLQASSRNIQELTGAPPRIVILTGGAARMDFIEEITKEVFPSPSSVRRAPEPEHTISIGLALAGSIRYRTQSFLKEINELINTGVVDDVIHKRMDSFAQAIADAVANDTTERFFLPEFLSWRSSGEGTLRDIAENISNRMEAWHNSEEGHKHILEALTGWYRQIENDLHKITAPICIKYNLDADVLDIPKAPFDPAHSNPTTDPEEVLFGTARIIMSAVLGAISFVVSSLLFGGGIVLLTPTGPLGVIVAGVVLWIFGETAKELAIERVMDMNLPRLVRQMYPRSFLESNVRRQASKADGEIHTEIMKSILGGYPEKDPDREKKERQAKENQDKIVQEISNGVEEALKQRAGEASVLII